MLLCSAPLFPERQLRPRERPLPTLGTGRGSTSPCPAGSGAARRPGPRPRSAGPPGPPAGPAPSTVCSGQPCSRSGRLGPGASGAGRARQASGTRGGRCGDPYLWAWLGFHPGPKDGPLEARDVGVGAWEGCVGRAQLRPRPPQPAYVRGSDQDRLGPAAGRSGWGRGQAEASQRGPFSSPSGGPAAWVGSSLGGGRVRALLLLCPRRPLVSSHLGRGPASHQPCHHSLSKPVALGGDAGPHLCLRVWSWGCRPGPSGVLPAPPHTCALQPRRAVWRRGRLAGRELCVPFGVHSVRPRSLRLAGRGRSLVPARFVFTGGQCGVCLVAGSVPLFKPSGPSALPVRLLDV